LTYYLDFQSQESSGDGPQTKSLSSKVSRFLAWKPV